MEQSFTSFDNLPDEILLKIFSYVPIAKFHLLSKVCQRFASIYEDQRFWTKVSLRNEVMHWNDFKQVITGPHPPIDELDMTGATLLGAQERNRNTSDEQVKLKKLILNKVRSGGGGVDNRPDEIEPVESAIVEACNVDDELTMHGVTFNDDLYIAIAKSAKLRVLSIDFAKLIGSTILARPWAEMLGSCSQLKELTVRFGVLRPPTLLRGLCFNASTTVEKLFLNHLVCETMYMPGASTAGGFMREMYSITALNGLIAAHLSMLFRRLQNLRHLGLSMIHLAAQAVFEQVTELPLLESLHFCLCDFEWKQFHLLSKILEKLPNLKRVHFTMSYCWPQDKSKNEETQRNLAKWFERLPGKETIITFTDTEGVIEFVNNNKY